MVGILIGILLDKYKYVPEFFKNTESTETNTFLKVNFENKDLYNIDNKVMYFKKDIFETPGRFDSNGVKRTNSSDEHWNTYLIKVVHDSSGKKILQFGDDRDLKIKGAIVNKQFLKDSGENCIVKKREIIILPKGHAHAPDNIIEFREGAVPL